MTELELRAVLKSALVGDAAAVECFVAKHQDPHTTNVLMDRAIAGGRIQLVRLLLTKHGACPEIAMSTAVSNVETNVIRGPHFDIVRMLLELLAQRRLGKDTEERRWCVYTGFTDAVVKGNLTLVALFLGHVDHDTLAVGFNCAVRVDNLDMMRFLFNRGAVGVTAGLLASKPGTSDDVVLYLIERGATDWPMHVYIRLSRSPDLVIHLHKFGIPHDLLVGGRASIRLILDEHVHWCAHVRETLDELGVYAVLANLIVEY